MAKSAEDIRQFLGQVGMVVAASAALVALVIANVFDKWAVQNDVGVIWATRRSRMTLPGAPWDLLAMACALGAFHLWRRYVREQPPPKAPPLDFATTRPADAGDHDELDRGRPESN